MFDFLGWWPGKWLLLTFDGASPHSHFQSVSLFVWLFKSAIWLFHSGYSISTAVYPALMHVWLWFYYHTTYWFITAWPVLCYDWENKVLRSIWEFCKADSNHPSPLPRISPYLYFYDLFLNTPTSFIYRRIYTLTIHFKYLPLFYFSYSFYSATILPVQLFIYNLTELFDFYTSVYKFKKKLYTICSNVIHIVIQ
jgi:hypothetical protein